MILIKKTLAALAGITGVVLLAAPAFAQERDEYGEAQQTVARVGYIDGSASFSRGDDPDNWQTADRNVPMTIGDRLYTGSRSRAEVAVDGGYVIRLGARADVATLNLTDDTKQFAVKSGVVSFHIRRLDPEEIFEVDTPNAAVTFEQPGYYRVDVDPDGNTRVVVRRGQAVVAAGGGQVPLNAGDVMNIEGLDSPRYDVSTWRRGDSWDRWVDSRQGRFAHTRSWQYMSDRIVGADDLDEYGRWEDIPEYGHVWTPATVAVDWAPYRVGHWVWQDPFGWTWVSSEPWGWAPYHYGRWVTYSSRWYWVPVARRAVSVSYAPALVAFVGSGPGWSASVSIGGGGFVGWFPLAPQDPLVPWWGARRGAEVNVTNVTYVNKTYVTVVNQNTFVSGGVVANSFVRDRSVIQQVSAAPVAYGPIPVVPTRQSLRAAVGTNLPAPQRPPAAVVERAVVARVAPPPAPPTFAQKLAVIQQNHGAPVAPVAAAKISVQERGGGRPQAITQVRPVAATEGRVTLAPANQAAGAAARVQPVAPVRDRPMATAQQPVAAAPVVSRARGGQPREAPTSVPAYARPIVTQPAAPQTAPPTRPVMVEPARPETVRPTRPETPPGRNEDWRNRQRPTPITPAPAYAPPTAIPRERVERTPFSQQRAYPTPPGRSERVTPIDSRQQERIRPERAENPAPQRGRERAITAPPPPPTPPPARQMRSEERPTPPRATGDNPPDRSRSPKKEDKKQDKNPDKKTTPQKPS